MYDLMYGHSLVQGLISISCIMEYTIYFIFSKQIKVIDEGRSIVGDHLATKDNLHFRYRKKDKRN